MGIELSQTAMMWLGGGLLAAGLAAMGPSSIKSFAGWLQDDDGDTAPKSGPARLTDAACPTGFCEHVAVIIESSPAAHQEIQLAYMLDGLTEAEVLRAEVTRLSSPDIGTKS